VQPLFVVGFESVCRPSDVAIGAEQHRTRLDVRGGTVRHIDTVEPSGCGVTDTPA
jgi:hypothetical protein